MSFANRALAMLAVAAAILVALSAVPASDAIGEDLSGTYGSPTNIDIAPGYQWRYTAEFPSDLSEYVTVSLKVNDGNIGSVSGKSVTVTIPKTATVGTVYNVVIQASMTQPVSQTSYQYVTFTVVAGLSVSGTINDIIKGSAISFTPTGSSYGERCWALVNLVRSCLQAKLLGDQIGLAPLPSLFAVYVGWQTCGVGGMLLFPVLLTTLRQLNDRGVVHLWRSV